MLAAMARHQRIVVEAVDAVEFCGDPSQFTIDLPDESGLSRFRLAVENAQTRSGGAFEGMNDQRRLTVFSKRANPLLITANHALGGLLCCFRSQIGEVAPQFGCGLIGAHRQHDGIGREAIEGTLAVEQILHVGVEISNVDFEIDAAGERFRSQQRHDGLDRERTQNRQLEFCKCQLVARLISQFVETRRHEGCCARRGITPPEFRQPSRGQIESAFRDQPVDLGTQARRMVLAKRRIGDRIGHLVGDQISVPDTQSANGSGCRPRRFAGRRRQLLASVAA